MRRPQLCVTVTGQTLAELRARRDQVDADLVELRLDMVRDPSAAGALEGRRTPVIVTCRPKWEGGHFEGSEEERRHLLHDARRLGAEYVDVEYKAGFEDLIKDQAGRGVIVSTHDFNGGAPADLESRVAAMRATGAEIVKVAIMAQRLSDCLPLLCLGRAAQTPIALIAMGEPGLASRVLAAQFGSCWTYAGDAVAPGQIPASQLTSTFRFRTISERTTVYGVVGRPVTHSLSPAMHNAALAATHIDSVYLPLAATDFADFQTFADAIRLEGASVTAPFKVDAFEGAIEHDGTSERIRAANTLKRGAGGWSAMNTDAPGFLRPLQAVLNVSGRRVTIMGGGGAARAAAEALSSAGAVVSIAARRSTSAEETARLTGSAVTQWPPAAGSWDVLVNATPAGTWPDVDTSPLPQGPFTGQLVYDLVYNPAETRLLREARSAGCRTLGGLDMLVAQAALQFAWWTGHEAPEDTMRTAAVTTLAQGTLGTLGTL